MGASLLSGDVDQLGGHGQVPDPSKLLEVAVGVAETNHLHVVSDRGLILTQIQRRMTKRPGGRDSDEHEPPGGPI